LVRTRLWFARRDGEVGEGDGDVCNIDRSVMPSAAYIVRVARGGCAFVRGMRAVAGGIGARARGVGTVAETSDIEREGRGVLLEA
jgi:hypothetical protein